MKYIVVFRNNKKTEK